MGEGKEVIKQDQRYGNITRKHIEDAINKGGFERRSPQHRIRDKLGLFPELYPAAQVFRRAYLAANNEKKAPFENLSSEIIERLESLDFEGTNILNGPFIKKGIVCYILQYIKLMQIVDISSLIMFQIGIIYMTRIGQH